jgi:hypothetical protein
MRHNEKIFEGVLRGFENDTSLNTFIAVFPGD